MQWVRVGKWQRHIGTYRAVATTAKWTVVPSASQKNPAPPTIPSPTKSGRSGSLTGGRERPLSSSRPATPSPLGVFGTVDESSILAGLAGEAQTGLGLGKGESLVQLSYSARPSASSPEPLIIFSNFNFTQYVFFLSAALVSI